jgi:UDP-N-acetylmuramoyl-tripeptide--D-alanyl-D-alanine ligase
MKTLKEYGLDTPVSGFSLDSRQVKPGHLFFALKGERTDGHSHLAEVAAKGAIAAVVASDYCGPTFKLELIKVPDVLAVLQKMARQVIQEKKPRVIAVTGSVGKSTTKEMIALLLSKKYRVSKTPGNANSQMGFPLSILNGAGDGEIFVAEMGMNYPNEIDRLLEIAPPEIGVITKIGQAHMGNFTNGIEGIATEKSKVLRGAKIGIVPLDAMKFKTVQSGGCEKVVTFAPEGADYSFHELMRIQDSPHLMLPFIESHLYENFLCAAAVARELGVGWSEIQSGINQFKGIELRFEKYMKKGVLYISDCYSSNPDSMKAALMNLPKPRFGGKVVGVFGEMAEQGSFSKQTHEEVAHFSLNRVDHALFYGKECLPMLKVFEAENKVAEFFHDLELLKIKLSEIVREGDVVLIKGKNTNKLWQILESIH